MTKKELRESFRQAVFERDGYRCAMCGYSPPAEAWAGLPLPLDAHHICDRSKIPFGGYVRENGISLCPDCHTLAEVYHACGKPAPGYSSADLYTRIHSDYDTAVRHSLRIGCDEETVTNHFRLLDSVKAREAELAAELSQVADATTWELSCLDLNITDADLLLYGQGRF
ncbi:HNH endonuclease [Fimbriiglobus ruber]|uniref:HNH endonuclease n=1 Tax=Fimbriiglobus ruber TaxID=1908690 RepID=UPI000B4ABE44|nr:HNH endonuclease signature motif containing protein [Fimbriiglobus ruber]